MIQTYTKPALTDQPKGYDPQTQGFQYQTSEQPTITRIHSSLPAKPQAKSEAYVTTMSVEDWMNTPVQWNAAGVYGGIIESRKGFPVWGRILLAVLVLVLAAAFWMMLH